jgi:hypothetical protein
MNLNRFRDSIKYYILKSCIIKRFNGHQNSMKVEKGDFKKSQKKKRQSETNYQILQILYNQIMELRNRVESEKNYVDPSTVFKGLDYYRFLMESLPPASIPGINLFKTSETLEKSQ